MQDFLEFISLSDPNVQFVVLGMVLLGICSAIVGCFTFLRKRALIGDAVAHAVLPGVCLAFIISGTKNPIFLLIGATITGWLSLVLIDWITAKSRIKADAAIGLVLSVFFGIGILLLTMIQHSGNAAQSGLDKFLFGKAASLVGDDLWVFSGLSILLITVILSFFKEFTLISFDTNFANAVGLPVRKLEIALATITVLAVSIGIQAVGVVLMAALLITPAIAARYWTDNLKLMVFLAAIFGALAGIGGAYVSYTAPSMPTGPWVVVVLSVIAIGSLIFAPKKGFVAKYYQERKNRLQMLEENILKIFFHLGEEDKQLAIARSKTVLQKKRYIPNNQLATGLKRLQSKEWVEKNKSDFQLTTTGQEKAKNLVRTHRLWELYLTKHLHLPPDHVHEDAEAIEHIITPELAEELEKLLGHPTTDPHNSDIPY